MLGKATYKIGLVKIPLPDSIISQTEWSISKFGKKENYIWQLATTSCGHGRKIDNTYLRSITLFF